MKLWHLLMFIVLLILLSCSQNRITTMFQTEKTQVLPSRKKLVSVSWVSGNAWYLMRDRLPNEKVESYVFRDFSRIKRFQTVIYINETE